LSASTEDMEVFVRVVEEGSFAAAARALGLPKSNVSRRVARLEDHLGARLLHRTTRQLSLTEVGAAYHGRVTAILDDLREAEDAVRSLHTVPRGTLRVSAPLTLGYRFLGEIVASFMQSCPEVQVDLSLSDRVVDLIEEGFDVAVRVGRLADSSMIAKRLASGRRALVASPAYLREHGAPARPDDLRDHHCLLYTYEASGSSWRVGDTSVPVKGRLVSNNGDVLLAAAVAGLGVALVPRFMCGPLLANGTLVELLAEHASDDAAIHALYPHNRHLSAKVRAFVDHLAMSMSPVPPWEAAPRRP
jgi:DNA-binding transcriptional LysR family regulator